ncbi:hypothetical protein BJX70DRAFT_375610 [Aspergillus crustosus]
MDLNLLPTTRQNTLSRGELALAVLPCTWILSLLFFLILLTRLWIGFTSKQHC